MQEHTSACTFQLVWLQCICHLKEDIHLKKKLITGIAAAAVLTSTAIPAINHFPIAQSAQNHNALAATAAETAFLKKASRQAQKASKKYGVYPSVMIAQAIVESDWGQSTLATEANNLFGMKADDNWTGASLTLRTREENSKGKSYYINAAFRKYLTYEGSFDDNGKKLRLGVSWQPTRYSGAWIENASSYLAATKALTGTYATDHKYNQTLNSRITQYDLTQYDPVISNTVKSYKVGKSVSTYVWPTDHSVSAKESSVKRGQRVNVDKTITYYDGSKRMHIKNKGWVDGNTFSKSTALPASQSPKGVVSKNLMHDASVYDSKGKRIKKAGVLRAYRVLKTYGTKTIKGRKFYRIGKNSYVVAGNIDGDLRILSHDSCIYNGSGNRDNNLLYKKGRSVATFGSAVKIMGTKYYIVGIHQFIKAANFAK